MSINMHAYKAIEAVVGSNYITDDPVDCEGYRSGPGGYESGTGYESLCPGVMITSPLVGSSCPDRIRKKVDFPAPLAPMSP